MALFEHALSFLDALDLVGVCVTSTGLARLVPNYVSHAISICLARRAPADSVYEPFANAVHSAFRLVCDRARFLRKVEIHDRRVRTPVGNLTDLPSADALMGALTRMLGRCKATLRIVRLRHRLHSHAVWAELAACPQLQRVWFPLTESARSERLRDIMAELPRVATRVRHLTVSSNVDSLIATRLLEQLRPLSIRTLRIGLLSERGARCLERFTNCRRLHVAECETRRACALLLESVEKMRHLAVFQAQIRPLPDNEARLWSLPPSLHTLLLEGLVFASLDGPDAVRFGAPGATTFATDYASERALAMVLSGAPALRVLKCRLMIRSTPGNRVLVEALRTGGCGSGSPLRNLHISGAHTPLDEAVLVAASEACPNLESLRLFVDEDLSSATIACAVNLLDRLQWLVLASEQAAWSRDWCVAHRNDTPAREHWSREDIEREIKIRAALKRAAVARAEAESGGIKDPVEEEVKRGNGGVDCVVGGANTEEKEEEDEEEEPERRLATVVLSIFDVALLSFLGGGVRNLHVADPFSVDIDLAVIFTELPNLETLLMRTGRGLHCRPPPIPVLSEGDADGVLGGQFLQRLTLDCLDGGFADFRQLASWCPRLHTICLGGADVHALGEWLLDTPDRLVDLQLLFTAASSGSVPPSEELVARLKAARPDLEACTISQDELDRNVAV